MEEREQLRVARDWHGPSPKRFLGWEPTWVTEYEYDGDRLVRSVTRMAEPEWDDNSRARAEGLALMERDVCPGCGLHSSILDHPEKHRFTFDERVCAVCKAQDTYGRVVADRDEKAGEAVKNMPPNVPRPGDGRHLYLRPLTDEEKAEADREASTESRSK